MIGQFVSRDVLSGLFDGFGVSEDWHRLFRRIGLRLPPIAPLRRGNSETGFHKSIPLRQRFTALLHGFSHRIAPLHSVLFWNIRTGSGMERDIVRLAHQE